jgi:hypothetical protein
MHITLISIIASTISKISLHFSTLFSFTSSFYKSVNNKYKTSYEISAEKTFTFNASLQFTYRPVNLISFPVQLLNLHKPLAWIAFSTLAILLEPKQVSVVMRQHLCALHLVTPQRCRLSWLAQFCIKWWKIVIFYKNSDNSATKK